MDGQAAERADSDRIRVVERRRAEGASVAAACREAGISTSTYYRKRRAGSALAELVADGTPLQETPPRTVGLLANGEGRSWPFTARAPFYWDQVFADELTDSFVRREFGRGPAKASSGALKTLAQIEFRGVAGRALNRLASILPRARKTIAGPVVATAFLAIFAAVSVWAVSVAADPAAWIDPSQTRMAESQAEHPLSP